MKLLEVSVVKISEVSAKFLTTTLLLLATTSGNLTSCALAEKIGTDVMDGSKALTVVTAQKAIMPITKPIIESLDNFDYKIDLVIAQVDNIAKNQRREDAKIAQIEVALKALGEEVSQIGEISGKILKLERKILRLNLKVKGISHGSRKEGKIAVRRLNR